MSSISRMLLGRCHHTRSACGIRELVARRSPDIATAKHRFGCRRKGPRDPVDLPITRIFGLVPLLFPAIHVKAGDTRQFDLRDALLLSWNFVIMAEKLRYFPQLEDFLGAWCWLHSLLCPRSALHVKASSYAAHLSPYIFSIKRTCGIFGLANSTFLAACSLSCPLTTKHNGMCLFIDFMVSPPHRVGFCSSFESLLEPCHNPS